MAKKSKTEPKVTADISNEPISLGKLLSTKAIFQTFRLWIVGDTPLIVHSWSHKAKLEMLQKQVKATRAGKEARDPQQDFVDSLYEMEEGVFGFPATGLKNAIVTAAHKDKGVARTEVLSGLFIDADMVRVRPALAGAICDVPLIRIYGSDPAMREDMVRIGKGLQKTANLAYRGQFSPWAMKISGKFNPKVFSAEALAFLIQESGLASGLGEWRNEKRGLFGAFHLANVEEEKRWENFAHGKGPVPLPENYKQAAE